MLTEQEKGLQREGEVRNSKQRRIYMPVCILSHFSHVWLSATPWTVARQAPLFMGFPRQEYWSWLPCPPLGDLPNWGIKPKSLMSPALAGEFFTTSATWEAPYMPIIPQIKKKKKKEEWLLNETWRRQKEIESRTQVTEVVSPRRWRGTLCPLRPTILASIL